MLHRDLVNRLRGIAALLAYPLAERFEGRDVTSLAPHQRCRRGIGRSYQVPQPFGHMTVFENLVTAACFGGGQPEREAWATARDVLSETGLLSKAKGFELDAFAATERVNSFGQIVGARSGGEYLSLGDTVYIRADEDIQVGETYAITTEPQTLGRKERRALGSHN